MYEITTATRKIQQLNKRIRVLQGGTSSSKTISVLLILIHMAQSDEVPTLTSIVSETMPHLRKGAMRDFLHILQTHHYYKEECWNKSNSAYTFETGSIIEFFSADQPTKVHGPRRDRLFINEANNVPYSVFDQLEVRTKDVIFIDFNPTNEFWYFTDVKDKRDDVETVIVTYRDNEALSPEIIRSIEQRKNNKNWWQVYGEGLLGEVDGKIYKDWQIIDDVPHEARLVRRGLDFGYTNDPSSLVDVYKYNDGFILDEIMYQKGMSNRQIADTILALPQQCLVMADSAEPKSIDEIRMHGVNILGADKGQGSVNQGIQFVQDQRMSVTKRSVNVIREYRNYFWKTDKESKVLNEPEHDYSHCFAPSTLVLTDKGYERIDKISESGLLVTRGGLLVPYFGVRKTRKDAEVVNVLFDDGKTLSVTPDHLLLRPDGMWIEAGLLVYGDLIQSATYESNASSRRNNIHKVSESEILQGLRERQEILHSQIHLGEGTWGDSRKTSYTSQGRGYKQQLIGKSGVYGSLTSSLEVLQHDSGEERAKAAKFASACNSKGESVAFIKKGDCVACATWQESVCKEVARDSSVRFLSQGISNTSTSKECKILSSKLQDESATKTVIRVTRGFEAVTYNLEVPNWHCLLADGVIAHNSMDAIRYALAGYRERTATPVHQFIPAYAKPRTGNLNAFN